MKKIMLAALLVFARCGLDVCYASGLTTFSAIKAAVAAADSGDTVTLSGNITWPESTIALPANITIKGDGTANIVKTGTSHFIFSDTGYNNIIIKNLSFNIGKPFWAQGGKNILLDSLTVNGYDSLNHNIIQQPIRFKNCDSCIVNHCSLTNIRDGIYCDKNILPSGRIWVLNSVIVNTTRDYGDAFPTGVYGYYVDSLYVDNCSFTDILPGDTVTNPIRGGYGVYEGDGSVQKLNVVNCTFNNTTSDNHYYGILISQSIKSYAMRNTITFADSNINNYGIYFYFNNSNRQSCIRYNNLSKCKIFFGDGGATVQNVVAYIYQNSFIHVNQIINSASVNAGVQIKQKGNL